ncbi:hypothetical protein MNBD_GAMMA12-2329 [hydrothermal vent metagenome]|uniref:Uncharacterized protein n=1 Tax=hydrothermal vent metagenome TaxID=652676 RepID=A0A3B0YSF3_9ZZZZ
MFKYPQLKLGQIGVLSLIASLLFLVTVSSTANAASCGKQYRVSAGVLKHYTNRKTGKPDVRIGNYTTRIPLFRRAKLNPYYFGVLIRPRHRRPYTIEVTYEVPHTNKINSSYFKSVTRKGHSLVLREKEVTVTGKGAVRMRLSVGDQPGIYKARVKVNKRLCRVVSFRVYKNIIRKKSRRKKRRKNRKSRSKKQASKKSS